MVALIAALALSGCTELNSGDSPNDPDAMTGDGDGDGDGVDLVSGDRVLFSM